MRLASLLYHDVATRDGFDGTGFQGRGADLYKIEPDVFSAHLARIASLGLGSPVRSTDGSTSAGAGGWALTVDDGGVTSATIIAPALDALGWRAHFFVTTGRIGDPRFVSEAQVRELHRAGHVVGSHTATHPPRLSSLPYEAVLREWRVSIDRLSDVLGERVRVGSVPGGYYSRKVLDAAREAGIEILFTSEPVTRAQTVEGCLVLGRFHVKDRTTEDEVANLLTGARSERSKQWLGWNARRVVKKMGGGLYVKLRERLLTRGR